MKASCTPRASDVSSPRGAGFSGSWRSPGDSHGQPGLRTAALSKPHQHAAPITLPASLQSCAPLRRFFFFATALLWYHSHTTSILEYIHHLKRKLHHPSVLSYPPSSWQPLICFLSLWICLFWTFHINGIIQYVRPFVSDFFHLTQCFQSLPMLYW